MCQPSNFKGLDLNDFYIVNVWENLKFHNSQALPAAEALLQAFDGLHDDIIFCSHMFLPEVII